MSKTNKARFDEALATLEAYGKTRVNSGPYFAVLTWLSKQAQREAAKETMGALISLDTHAFQAEQRKLGRAYLLLCATCGGKTVQEVKSIRDQLRTLSAVEYNARLPLQMNNLMARFQPIAGRLVVAPDMPTHKINSAMWETAFQTARHVIGKAKHALEARACDAAFVKWFGEYHEGRYNTVKNTVSYIATSMFSKTIHLKWNANATDLASALTYTWGHAKDVKTVDIVIGPKFFGDCAAAKPTFTSVDLTKLEDVISARQRLVGDEDRAIERALGLLSSQAEKDAKRQELKAEYKAKRAALVAGVEDKSIIGYPTALIHEMSHAVASRIDMTTRGLTVYGNNLCRWLAGWNPTEAVMNADNYRLFCDEFL